MRGILFDLDDTLYPRELYLQSGFEAVADHVADSWRRSREDVVATLRRAHSSGWDGEEFQMLCTEHRLPLSIVPMLVKTFRQHRPTIALLPAVRCVLQQLRRDGWRLGILTNGDPAVQRRKVEALSLSPLVDCVTYAEEHSFRGKPHPDAFRAALVQLDVTVNACLHVGDDPLCDISGAQSAGLRAIRVLSPPAWTAEPRERAPRWRSSAADATVDTVLDVAAIAPIVLMETPRAV